MTDKKSSESRRKLLKSIAAGSGAVIAGKSLPESWTRPVVNSVMLPAHAQTSGLRTYFGEARIIEVQSAISDRENMLASVAGKLINDAHAGWEIGSDRGWLCGTEMTDTVHVQFLNNRMSVLREGTLQKTGVEGVLVAISDNGCGEIDQPAWIVDINDDYLFVNIQHEDGNTIVTYRVSRATSCNMPAATGECGL